MASTLGNELATHLCELGIFEEVPDFENLDKIGNREGLAKTIDAFLAERGIA